MCKSIQIIFPSIAALKADKIINGYIDQNDLRTTGIDSIKNGTLTIEELKVLYNTEISRKDSLEGKAKTSILGVTVAVTLMMGSFTLVSNLSSKYSNGTIFYLSVCVFVVSVLYMLIAGFHSMHAIMDVNMVYTIDKIDGHRDETINAIGLNRLKNMIRNNHAYASYSCIRNSLICLFAVMLLSVIPASSTQSGIVSHYDNFFFSEESMDFIKDNTTVSHVEDAVNEKIANNKIKDDETVTMIDDQKDIAITFSVSSNKVTVYRIDSYVN